MKYKFFLGSLLLIFLMAVSAQATSLPGVTATNSLHLYYSVTPIANDRYDYQFRLTLDNEDNLWESGHGWGQVVVGSGLGMNEVNLTDFVGDTSDLPVGPFTGFQAESGQFGPTLGLGTELWTPTAIGDSLFWSGTSTANVADGELHWFTKTKSTGAVIQVEYASRVSNVNVIPEPGTMVLAGFGLLCLMSATRRNPA